MSVSPSDLMEVALDVARAASAVAMRYYRQDVGVEFKADGSPVTIADRTAEEAARAIISGRYPDDAILGEEFGLTRGSAGRRWIIDPIDGTKSFVRGVPLWGTCVAVLDGDEVIAGAAAYPAVDEIIAAANGQGCWHNGSRCRVSRVDNLASATVLTTGDRTQLTPERSEGWESLASASSIVRGWGDCFGYLLVATGRAEVMVDPVVNAWDVAAFIPIIEEAGGVFATWRGTRDAFGGDAIASNRVISTEARRLLGAVEC